VSRRRGNVDAAEAGMSKSFQWMMKVEDRVFGAAADADADTSRKDSGTVIKMDPAFKLFGKTIAVAATTTAAAAPGFSDAGADAGALFGMRATTHWAIAPFCSQKNGNSIAMTAEDEQNLDELRSSSGSNSGVVDDDSSHHPVVLKTGCGLGPSGAEPSSYVDSAGAHDQVHLTQQTTTEVEDGEDDDKTLPHKSGKLVACPRCDSLDTKFCYYNNYNVNQPRHFCKNCQRYWTAGGSLRNVPVGAGRRKNKHSGGIHAGPSLQSSSDSGQVIEPVYQDSTQIDLSDGTRLEQTTSHRASALKIPQPRNLGPVGEHPSSSPLLASPGGSTDSCLTVNMSSPFPLHLSGSASLNPFAAATHNTMASFKSTSVEMGMKPSSDSPTRLGQMIKASYTVNGAALSSGEITTEHGTVGSSKEDAGSSLTGPMHTVVQDGHIFQHQHSPSAVYHQSMAMGDLGGWTSNGTPFSFFSEAWPYGYNVGWSGLPPVPSTNTFCTATTPGSLGCNPPSPKFASWCPVPPGALWTGGAPWAPGIPGMPVACSGVVPETNRYFSVSDAAASKVSAAVTSVSWVGAAEGWSLKAAPGGTAGKRDSPEGGKTDNMWGPKSMRIDSKTTNSNEWNNRVGIIKSDPDAAGTLSKTFYSKMENQTTTTTNKQFYNPHMFVNTMQFQETVT